MATMMEQLQMASQDKNLREKAYKKKAQQNQVLVTEVTK